MVYLEIFALPRRIPGHGDTYVVGPGDRVREAVEIDFVLAVNALGQICAESAVKDVARAAPSANGVRNTLQEVGDAQFNDAVRVPVFAPETMLVGRSAILVDVNYAGHRGIFGNMPVADTNH